MTSPRSILVVGAGLAGARCAETLRAEGFDGELTLVGEEPFAPYERPALSKEFLTGEKSAFKRTPKVRDRTTAAHACRLIEDRRDDPELDGRLEHLERAVACLFDALIARRG